MSTKEGEDFAKKHKMIFLESSAKNNINIEQAFSKSAEEIYKKVTAGSIDLNAETSGVKLGTEYSIGEKGTNSKLNKKSKCC